jgi:hypothetical protein
MGLDQARIEEPRAGVLPRAPPVVGGYESRVGRRQVIPTGGGTSYPVISAE